MAEQETQGGKFLPAFFVEPIALGETFHKADWPLHMTYFPPVSAQFKPEYAEKMRQYINPMEPFMATVGETDYFGENRDIPVKRLVHNERLLAVHRKLVAVLHHLPHSKTFRTPYNPHFSIKEGDSRLETGDSIEIGGFSVAEKFGQTDTWRIIAKIGLKGAEMSTDARIIKASQE